MRLIDADKLVLHLNDWTMRNVWGRYIGSDDWSEKSTNKCIKRRKNDERSIVRTSKYNA